jgi:sulfate adenylyltransferase subunit 1
MDILRFVTAGNVDDGKSSLIGRLLYDAKAVPEDLLEAVRQSSQGMINGEVNLALLTDGLKAEREQGITIDVAYKFFSTDTRKFIIADSPGHVQYTRNMITACSTADVAILLIDARNGVTEQTRRHSYIVSMMGVKHIIFAINKMDLVDYSEEVYSNIQQEVSQLSFLSNVQDKQFIPINSIKGGNLVHRSEDMAWYQGKTLMEMLEAVQVESDVNMEQMRFAVQYVIRPQTEEHHDFRGYAGELLSGTLQKGDSIQIHPSDKVATVKSLLVDNQEVDSVSPGTPVVITLEEDLDIDRGNLFTEVEGSTVQTSQDLKAQVCWMDSEPMSVGQTVLVQHNHNRVKAKVKKILSKKDMETLEDVDSTGFEMNDIGLVEFKTFTPCFYDNYTSNKKTGAFIFIDPYSHATLAAGVIE